ncbi:TyeA family type III secretion system gatekeeper subunit [Endozoicomonas sp. ONNA2]|uniref:TyeA family type III secretion system gatekeeper subunit n=1 Tax=Endozoicomonas sp. ONNA2 TaxID=2828741 RepID=UPI002147E3D2|nr:TyeA family type III secretion system gatekeeper subunit [Endozoicomonas sp. ONNA2]
MSNPLGGIQASGVQQLQASGAVAAGAAGQAGKLSTGQGVNASNAKPPALAAADVAEEMTAALAKFKKIDIKTSKDKSPSERQLELIKKIKNVEAVPETQDFKRRFTEQTNQDYTQEDYLEGAKDEFQDPYHQYLALYELAVDLKADPDAEIFKAIATLEKAHPQYINIGDKIADAAGELAEKYHPDKTPDEIRTEVFGHVKDHKSLSTAFNDLTNNLGGVDGDPDNNQGATGFENAVDRRLRLLSSELNALKGGADENHLRSVINDMTTLKRLVGIHDSCMETQGQMRRPPVSIEQFDGQKYMGEILKLLDQSFISLNNLNDVVEKMGMNESPVLQRTSLVNCTATLIKDIPEEIFVNQETKDNIRALIQEQQEGLVLEEDDAAAAQANDNFGKSGETEVSEDSLKSFLGSQPFNGSILEDLVGNTQESPFMASTGVPALGSGETQPEPATKSETSTTATKATTDPATGTSPGVTAKGGANGPSEVTAKGSLDGLSDQELIQKQDQLLDKARGLHQRKDSNYVFDCSFSALKHANEKGINIIDALEQVASQRGQAFAKNLKVAITPAGEGTELPLIPPDPEALKEWMANHPDQSVNDLVKTAMEVLEQDRGPDIDLEKLNNDLASLKSSIAEIDSKIKERPTKTFRESVSAHLKEGPFSARLKSFFNHPFDPVMESRTRPLGTDLFDRMEYSHTFNIRAEEKTMSVESTWNESDSQDDAEDIQVEATLDAAGNQDGAEGMTVEATFAASGQVGGSSDESTKN